MKYKIVSSLFICLFIACNKPDQTKHDVIRLRTEKMNLDICRKAANTDSISDWKLIIYTDSTQCTSCRMNDFIYWKPLLKEFESRGVETFFIFHPRHRDVASVELSLRAKKIEANVLVDSLGLFRSQNPQIPDNENLHSFLLDQSGKVVLVGNPIHSDQIKELMFRIIDETKQKEQ